MFFKKFLSKYFFFAFVLVLALPSLEAGSQTKSDELTRIVFGSCNRQNRSQDFWKPILAEKPDLFLFLGDVVYADTHNMRKKNKIFEQLFSNPDFQKLWASTRVEAIWDDHDFGENDTDGEDYPWRSLAQQNFLDAFKVPRHSPRRQREGIYEAWIQGPPGKKTQIILLDTRYFRSNDQKKNINPTILGELQWKWLKSELLKPADIRIIASGSQVVAYERHTENWGNFPNERKRLFDLVESTQAEGVFFISGDLHSSEISKTEEGPYPFYDFTSSSFNQTDMHRFREKNSLRIEGKAYPDPNYGVIEIDWNESDPIIRMITKSAKGIAAFSLEVRLSELQFKKSAPQESSGNSDA